MADHEVIAGIEEGREVLGFFDAHHLGALAVIAALALWPAARARRQPEMPWIRGFTLALAAVAILNQVIWHARLLSEGSWSAADALPFHLCDAAMLVAVVALIRPVPLAFELTYFWGLAGTVQGLLTPDIHDRFPHPTFLQFFIHHGVIVIAAVFLAFGLRHRPRPRVVLRVFLWTNALAAIAALANLLTGGNYMFLRMPPPTGSLLDHLGPWPWYLLACELLALALFALLALPFGRRRQEVDAPASAPDHANVD